ncbi:MAG TPA: GNAT family N-acetyltransferase [Pseudonocardia sp.]|nr:GNAT family N-acetyltransferase [Pseudonocardia sp.]
MSDGDPVAHNDNTDDYTVDDDPERLDLDAICAYLSTSVYWARWRPVDVIREQVRTAWRVVGAYAADGSQVGFARAVGDGFALAYLADVYVHDDHRGHGLGKRIVRHMIDDGPGAKFRWMLHTSDAQGLYHQFGFSEPGPQSQYTYLERPSTQG